MGRLGVPVGWAGEKVARIEDQSVPIPFKENERAWRDHSILTILCAPRCSEIQSLHAITILVIAKRGSPHLPQVRVRTGGRAGMPALRNRFLQIQTTGSGCRDSADRRH